MYIYRGQNNIYTHEYTKELTFLINDNYSDNKHSTQHTQFSYILEKKLNQSGVGEILDGINCFFTFFEIVFYIISTYTYPENGNQGYINANSRINIIEIILLVYFSLHFVLRFYVSQNRFSFFFDFINIIDCSTIICIICAHQSFVDDNTKYYMRMFRMIRFMYIAKIEDILQRHSNEQIRYSFKLVCSLIGIIFISTSIILELENDHFRALIGFRESNPNLTTAKGTWNLLRFHDLLYFEVITLTTIGFGDITPKSDLARVGTVFTIIMIIAVIPALYSKISIAFSLSSKYSRVVYKKHKKANHLVILGDCDTESYEACLQELYHEDHGDLNFDTIIMQTSPNENMVKICKDNPFANCIYYLVGDSLDYQDLKRCKANNALCIIVLANKLAKDYRQEDFSNIMKAFSVKKYISMLSSSSYVPNSRICIQLLLPETKDIYFSSLVNQKEFNKQDQIICVEEIKLQMLGKSCVCQGITTIIASLITSEKPTFNNINDSVSTYCDWYTEYLEGLGTEIYAITLKAELVYNMLFSDIVKIIYEITGFVVIGIDVIFDDMTPFVCLNPSNYVISPFNHLIYLLAYNQPNEKEINMSLAEYLEKNHKGFIENNFEMVKIKRLKNIYWSNLGNDGLPKASEGYQSNRSENIPLVNYSENEKDTDRNTPVQLPKANILLKRPSIPYANKQTFINTLHPRTQHDSESFSEEILDHHIVICGIGPNLKNLIMPLRTKSVRSKNYPILIFDKRDHIPAEIWKEIQFFPDVYFMQGNAIKTDDLRKANISRAEAVIILCNKNPDLEQIDMIDADTIFIYKAIKNEVKKSLIIADLNSVLAIGFICSSGDSNVEKRGFWLSEAFASGELYVSSMLDTLICQAFYNPYIMNIIQQLLLGEAAFSFPSHIMEQLKEKKIIQSTLYLLRIKEQLQKFNLRDLPSRMRYEDLFTIFTDKNMIPIGVLRNPLVITKQKKKFVYLAPSKEAMINTECDKIYVLSCEDEKGNESNINNQKDYVMSNMKLVEKSNEETHDLVEDIRAIVDESLLLFKSDLSVKKLVDHTRSCLRKEFVSIYQKREKEVLLAVDEEMKADKLLQEKSSESSNDNND